MASIPSSSVPGAVPLPPPSSGASSSALLPATGLTLTPASPSGLSIDGRVTPAQPPSLLNLGTFTLPSALEGALDTAKANGQPPPTLVPLAVQLLLKALTGNQAGNQANPGGTP
jgi:hypothetical protein